MSQKHEITFEEVNRHFEQADLSQFSSNGPSASAAGINPADALKKIASAYKVIKPFLSLVTSFPLIPSSWKAAINSFTSVMGAFAV